MIPPPSDPTSTAPARVSPAVTSRSSEGSAHVRPARRAFRANACPGGTATARGVAGGRDDPGGRVGPRAAPVPGTRRGRALRLRPATRRDRSGPRGERRQRAGDLIRAERRHEHRPAPLAARRARSAPRVVRGRAGALAGARGVAVGRRRARTGWPERGRPEPAAVLRTGDDPLPPRARRIVLQPRLRDAARERGLLPGDRRADVVDRLGAVPPAVGAHLGHRASWRSSRSWRCSAGSSIPTSCSRSPGRRSSTPACGSSGAARPRDASQARASPPPRRSSPTVAGSPWSGRSSPCS